MQDRERMADINAREQKPDCDDVDPDIRDFLNRMAADGARFGAGLTPTLAERRAIAEQVRRPWVEGGPVMAQTLEMRIGVMNVRVRIHYPAPRAPERAPSPALVYIHGGGWMLFSLDTHDRLMREYAAAAGVVVIGVDYALSPEVRFPHAIEEIASVVEWLGQHGREIGIDPERIAVGGDSAGANMTLASNLLLRARGSRMACAMLLNYGAWDMTIRGSHRAYDGEAYMLGIAEMEDFWDNYLRGEKDTRDPLARPLLADLRGLPSAFLCIARCDILADENHEMALRLREAGVPVEVRTYDGATHSFLEAMRISALAREAIADGARWLRARTAADARV